MNQKGIKDSNNFRKYQKYIFIYMNKNNTKTTETSTKWMIKEGGCMDSTIFTNGKRDISFDEWFQIQYRTKKK